MTRLLDGKAAAAALLEGLGVRVQALGARGISPTLALVRVGARPDAIAYENAVRRQAESLGIAVRLETLPDGAGADAGAGTGADTDAGTEARAQALQGRLRTLAEDGSVHGILPFLPLPDGMDEAAALAEIPAGKDVDGMGPGAQAAVYEGRLLTEGRAFAPCTAESVMRLLDHYAIDVAGRHAVVVGRSAVIGRPVSQLLLARHATVTICHTRTQDLAQFTKAADILVVCAGLASSGAGSGITARHLRAGQTVVDVGIHRDGAGDLYGDVDAQAALGLVADLTPVPGGVGAMTTPILLEHVVRAAEQQGAARPLT